MSFNYSLELFKNSSVGHFILSHKGLILKSNNSFNSMVGLNEGEGTNTNFFQYIGDEDLLLYKEKISPFLLNKKKSIVLNIRYKNKNGIGWWKLNLDKTVFSGAIVIMGVVVDIDQEIESQGSLLEAKQAAEKSEASKSIFLANMSHEIRTPIHTVTGLAELLQDTKLDGEQGEYVSQIEFAAKVLLTLINDILDFSKIEAGKMVFENVEYNLYETILNSVDLSALEAHKKGVDVAISLDKNMPTNIIGDQVRLRQIIVNLMSNAVKFTKEGEIILEVKAREDNKGQVYLKITVKDSGIGISQEKQSKLFKAFTQADTSTTREFGGTGLGLSISSSLVKMMGGKMEVSSKEGDGAAFYFEIPVTKGVDYIPKKIKPPFEKLKVLVVDDNKIVNSIFSDILKSWSYTVVQVYNQAEALKELEEQAAAGSPFDICFIDQILPGMDGWQLAGEIHSKPEIKETKKVLMSLKGKGIEESKMKLLGWFQGYVTKPVSKEEVYNVLTEIYKETKDDLEELEEVDDDDDFMEPLSFSDNAYDVVEILEPVVSEEVKPIPKNVLVVEDHLVNQKLFKTILEKSGYNVIVASDGKEAIDKVDENDLDLIFMDCQMPVMNGYDSTREIRNRGINIPIVAVTASAIKGEYDKCISYGMSDVMTKPFKKDDVLKSLEKWLRKETYMLFDYDKALERFMGEKDILIEVLSPYIENLDNCINELKTLNCDTDCKRIRELAHSIKGSSLNLDILAVGKEAEELEDLAFNESKEGIPGHIEKITDLAAQTKSELQKYL